MQIQSVFACIYAHKKLSAFIYISNLMSEGEPMKKEKRFSLLLPVVVCSILAITIYFQMTTGVISVSNTVNGQASAAHLLCPAGSEGPLHLL